MRGQGSIIPGNYADIVEIEVLLFALDEKFSKFCPFCSATALPVHKLQFMLHWRKVLGLSWTTPHFLFPSLCRSHNRRCLQNLSSFCVLRVWIAGRLVANAGRATFEVTPLSPARSCCCLAADFSVARLRALVPRRHPCYEAGSPPRETLKCNVIGLIPGALVTKRVVEELPARTVQGEGRLYI